jgi:Ca2+-transporting ATPase
MKRFDDTVAEASALGTDVDSGLAESAVERQRAAHGENRMPPLPGRSLWAMFLGAINDKTLLILVGAALLAIGVELLQATLVDGYAPHYVDGIAILCAVLVASLVTTFNEYRANQEFRSLERERADVPVKVLRGGHVGEVSIYDLVVGDVVHLGAGDRVPADGALIAGVDVRVDQSMLTGESIHVEKGAEDRALIGGSIVEGGTGTMLVTAVGAATEMGRLQAALTGEEEGPTPLQERLSKLADRIGLFGLGAAVLTFLALSGSALYTGRLDASASLATGAALLQFLIVAVTIVVVAVPEGLPVAVTISLAYSVRKMALEKNLVRKLASCETMGAATVICSDKTGTLTLNRMTVADLWLDGAPAVDPEDRARFAEIASIDSTAFLETIEGQTRYVGNPTECALLAQVAEWSQDWRGIRAEADVVHLLGFTSDRKRMSTLVRRPDGGFRLLVKGAPEVLLARADRLHRRGGDATAATAADREAVERAIHAMSALGHRTLGLAYRDLPADDPSARSETVDADALERELVLFALVGIADPVRPEVKAAVAAARQAGVEVKMLTGDNRIIAETIAREIGMLGDGDLVLEGEAIRKMSDEEVSALLPRLRVLARSVPTDKHRLVRLLQARGQVVAVTGDGTNDAPALRAADVGFSMGLSGTEVAKEASDIVILDDNFASIVRAIRWGRGIFENIRKFLQFQLTVNVVALSTAFLAAVFGFGIPLNTVQLLWVNLIMDTLAALALAVEPPSPALLEDPPHGRHAPLITRSMWTSILGMGAVMVAVLMLTMWTGWLVPLDAPEPVRLTFVFNTFVWMQLFNEVNARSTRWDRGVLEQLSASHLFVGVLVLTAILQVGIVQYGGAFFRTVPLDGGLWLRSILVGAAVLVLGVVLRGIGRALPPDWFVDPTPTEG